MATTVLHGTIRGRTIELEQDSGLPDGESVRITVVPTNGVTSPIGAEALESLKRAAGGWADDVEGLDRYLEWNRQQRKCNRAIPE